MSEELTKIEVPTRPASTLVEQVRTIQEVMQSVMKPGEHYGVIPGTKKETLLKPGAEKLCLTFRLAPSYSVETVPLDGGHREQIVTCTLTHIETGRVFGEGLGSCSTMESKYRWRQAQRKCPGCEKDGTIIKGKREYGGGWLCFAKKGGCGGKWPDGAREIESQSTDKVENPDIADCYNTVLKMSKKRAHVDAVLTATGASDIFAQDLEDLPTSYFDGAGPGAATPEPQPTVSPAGGSRPAPSPSSESEYQKTLSDPPRETSLWKDSRCGKDAPTAGMAKKFFAICSSSPALKRTTGDDGDPRQWFIRGFCKKESSKDMTRKEMGDAIAKLEGSSDSEINAVVAAGSI